VLHKNFVVFIIELVHLNMIIIWVVEQEKQKKCHPVGPIHSIKSYSKCIWKKTAPNSHRRLCCRHISNCIGDKCVQLKPNCRFIGKTTGSKTQCRYINIRNKQHRRKCCVFTTSCDKTLETGKKCAPTKKKMLLGKCKPY